MKRFLSLIFAAALLLAFVLPISVYAKSEEKYVIDEAGLLSEKGETELNSLIKEARDEIKAEIVVVTKESYSVYSYYEMEEMADSEADSRNEYEDKIVLLFVVYDLEDESPSWHISTAGEFEDAIPDDDITDFFVDNVASYLKSGDYKNGFEAFVESAKDEFKSYKRSSIVKRVVISLIVGLIIAWAVTSSMKSKLNSVALKSSAGDYVRPGSLDVRESQDVYLYSNTVRTVKQSDSSRSGGGGGHYSSSGSHHGGGGGRL